MQPTTSPYTPPQRELIDEQTEFGPIRIFSAKGRLGRLRYIAYSIGVSLVIYLFMGILLAALGVVMDEGMLGAGTALITSLGLLTMLFVNVLLTIQRCHDFNVSGWLSLLLLLPFVPLIFWIIPGTQGINNFGPQPPPNRGAAVIVAVLLILVAVIGILAAIAIPAYQDYVARAQAMGM